MPSIAITTTTTDRFSEAQQLAKQLQLDCVSCNNLSTQPYDYFLILTPTHIGLQKASEAKLAPFYIDFLSSSLQYRQQHASRRKELIGRAMGIAPPLHPHIIDATAGLGRDSFILATLGYAIILLERSPILYVLLNDALTRAQQFTEMAPIINRMQLIHADANAWLPTASITPDIIYLDPMFPLRQKTAAVKKEMVLLQDLLGKDEDAADLFRLALTCAKQRVVVKRPRIAANIGELAPNFSLTGKSSRFDIYLT